jgi:transposase InsO family protein
LWFNPLKPEYIPGQKGVTTRVKRKHYDQSYKEAIVAEMRGAIHHSDADVRYGSHDYVARMRDIGMNISMICGDVSENAHAESLNKTVKYKLVFRN